MQRAELALDVNDPATYQSGEIQEADEQSANGDFSKEEVEEDVVEWSGEPDWSRRAYVQMVSTADEICNAIMGVTSLSIQGSKPRRLLIYPSGWGDSEDLKIFTKELELITMAKEEHLLETLTTEQVAFDGDLTDSLLNQDYDKLLFLEPKGLIINATRLDQIFEMELADETLSFGSRKENAAVLLRPRQSHVCSMSIEAEDMEEHERLGMVETIDSLQLSRNADNGYSQEQLLGDIGYLRLASTIRPDASQDVRQELRKRELESDSDVARTSLLELILERYATEKAAVCGDYIMN